MSARNFIAKQAEGALEIQNKIADNTDDFYRLSCYWLQRQLMPIITVT